MSQISQIQIKFIATEDRLLLRVSSSNQQEFRFWLTARLVRMLYPALYDALAETSPIAPQSVPEAKQEVLAFEHQQAVAKTDFDTGFKEIKQDFPLGELPILVTRCQLRPHPDGNTVLALAPEKGQGIDVNLSNELLHSFTKLLVDACKIAEWPLDAKTLGPVQIESGENITLN